MGAKVPSLVMRRELRIHLKLRRRQRPGRDENTLTRMHAGAHYSHLCLSAYPSITCSYYFGFRRDAHMAQALHAVADGFFHA